MNIHNMHVCKTSRDTEDCAVSASKIARMLHEGDRIMVDPIGEVFVINDNNGVPEVEFIFENTFITAMLDIKIHELERYKQSLQEKE